jgi:hypothetical protein
MPQSRRRYSVRRAAEDGARAVVHDDEVGDIDRQRGEGVDRMLHAGASVEALLLLRLERGRGRYHVPASLDEGGCARVAFGDGLGQRMVRSDA